MSEKYDENYQHIIDFIDKGEDVTVENIMALSILLDKEEIWIQFAEQTAANVLLLLIAAAARQQTVNLSAVPAL